MRTLIRTILLALPLIALAACGLSRAPEPAPAPAEAPAPQAAPEPAPPAPAPVRDETAAATELLNRLVNDTTPDAPDWPRLRAELAAMKDSPALPADLRRAAARAASFDPPQLAERWRRHDAALDALAAHYAEHPPVDTDPLQGARVAKRLGPALYLVRLPGGDTAFLHMARRLKPGAKLDNVPAIERPRARPDRASGDLVDELAESGREFAAIGKDELKRLKDERAPILARLKRLEDEREAFQKDIQNDLAALDILARDVNAVLGPRILGGVPVPPAREKKPVIRQVKRLGRSYSPVQFYRYALPVTGRPMIDAVLRGYLAEREREVQDLLKSVGVGRGLARTNTDLASFQRFRAGERLLSVRFEAQRDTGGAHPNANFAAFTFDLASQQVLGLGDLFRDLPAALALLSELATRRLTLTLDGHVFTEGLEPRAENFQVFVLDGLDLVLTFPPYQTGSYADGPQTVRVPLFHPRLLPLLSPRLMEALGARPGA